jgi:C-terminal processing protease CtpA/Prc
LWKISPDGTVLEGYGVVPNIEVGLDHEKLFKGIDSQLETAKRYLKKELPDQIERFIKRKTLVLTEVTDS